MNLLMIVLVVGFVYRATILTTQDRITDPFRHWLARRYTGSLVTLFSCGWCISVWIAAGAVLLARWQWADFKWVCLAATASGAAGFLFERS